MASVTLSGITKSFGETSVIQGVDIAIGDGEFAVFVGPSGCGKSTLLRMIAGLDAPTTGEIRIGDTVVNDVPPKQREVSMVFQTYALYPHMTVRENMGFGLMIAGTAADAIGAKVAGAARMLGLDALLDRLPKQLSGGQRQRVAMGRAMVRDPKVFLFDEPLSNLDAKLRVQMRTEIRALHQRLKTTSIYVTHDQVEAMTMADRIVVLRDGRVEQVGTPVELYDRPGNAFVATFIGSPAMNLLSASVHGGRAVLANGDGIALPPSAAALEGRSILLGMRPEHLRLQPGGGLRARVKVVEFSGADTLLACQAGVAGNHAARGEGVGEGVEGEGEGIQVLVHDRTLVRPGDTVELGMAPADVHVFDAQSQQRLL